jgi:Xaa-Pro dipeptidase
LKISRGRKPELIRYAPDDYWYEQLPLGTPFWANGFSITEAPTLESVWAAVGRPTKAAYIGNELDHAQMAGLDPNPTNLTSYLNWGRSYKTFYEVKCLEEATEVGAKGHRAGQKAFLSGASELEIHYAFVQAMGCLDHQLPFPSIVALEPKGSILHYDKKRNDRNGKVLLLDGGAKVRGYSCDITRTTLSPTCDNRFAFLLEGLEKLQQNACTTLKPGITFGEIHHRAHGELGILLQSAGILKCGPEESLEKGLTRPFMPHGLGHFLGITTHDVAGCQVGPAGFTKAPPPNYPALRTTRTLEPSHVITVEPGLYFIPKLLLPFQEGEHACRFDWKLIDELTPLGGMRIEDDVLITETGFRNLTRERLPD